METPSLKGLINLKKREIEEIESEVISEEEMERRNKQLKRRMEMPLMARLIEDFPDENERLKKLKQMEETQEWAFRGIYDIKKEDFELYFSEFWNELLDGKVKNMIEYCEKNGIKRKISLKEKSELQKI